MIKIKILIREIRYNNILNKIHKIESLNFRDQSSFIMNSIKDQQGILSYKCEYSVYIYIYTYLLIEVKDWSIPTQVINDVLQSLLLSFRITKSSSERVNISHFCSHCSV